MISYNENDENDTLTHRMALIWKHVSENYADFRWYALCWDDNYVIPTTSEEYVDRSQGRFALAYEEVLFILGLPW